MNLAETDVNARHMIWRMYRDAADEDYLMARAASRQKLHYQFAWNAQQALEKYLKCSIILNGGRDEGFGHKLSPMLARMEFIAPELLPLILCPPFYIPASFSPSYKRFEPTRNFVSRMEEAGNPNNRYRQYSIVTDGYDLHKFDELCFQLRRTSFPLDMTYLGGPDSYRNFLRKHPSLQPHPFKFLDLPKKKEHRLRKRLLRWRNFSFYGDRARKKGEINDSWGAVNAEFFLAIQRGIKSKDALKWVTSKVHLPKVDRNEILDAISKMK